jgi:hypothetical protein
MQDLIWKQGISEVHVISIWSDSTFSAEWFLSIITILNRVLEIICDNILSCLIISFVVRCFVKIRFISVWSGKVSVYWVRKTMGLRIVLYYSGKNLCGIWWFVFINHRIRICSDRKHHPGREQLRWIRYIKGVCCIEPSLCLRFLIQNKRGNK